MCMQEKTVDQYNNSNTIGLGKQYTCRDCSKAYFKAWSASRIDKKQSEYPNSKTCRDCGLEKPISQFGKRSLSLDKHNIYCKPCWLVRCNKSKRKASR